MTCQPAYSILRRCIAHDSGEPHYSAIAEHLGIAKTTVIRWTKKRNPRGEYPRGTGGLIPFEYRGELVKLSQGAVALSEFEVGK